MPYIITNDGVWLHCLDEGIGLPVVLVAGFTAPAKSWLFQVCVAGGRYRVLSLDRRSHGRPDNPFFASEWRATERTSQISWSSST